jgi:hypothetical protein
MTVMSASGAKLNAMENRHAKDAVDSELDVCTQKARDRI